MTIRYNTRDGDGKDIVKEVEIKQFPTNDVRFVCPVCGKNQECGVKVRDAVSSNFTDYAYLGEYICEDCSRLFSLYFFCYEESANGIELFNIREVRDKILSEHEPPFRIVITKSRKKHLFYKSVVNHDTERFSINLEDEQIQTSKERMKMLFDFVECLITVGQSKQQMAEGEMSFQTINKTGLEPLRMLKDELKRSREIQIPLFCGQPRDMTEEEAIECITTLTRNR